MAPNKSAGDHTCVFSSLRQILARSQRQYENLCIHHHALVSNPHELGRSSSGCLWPHFPSHDLRSHHRRPLAWIPLLVLFAFGKRRNHATALEPSHWRIVVRPQEVCKAQPRRIRLLAGRLHNAMQTAPEYAACPLDHRIAEVYQRTSLFGTDVEPIVRNILAPGGQDLQAPENVEEHGGAAEVRVPAQSDRAVLCQVDGVARE